VTGNVEFLLCDPVACLLGNLKRTEYLNPLSRVLLEKLTVTQLFKKFITFYGTHSFIIVFTRASHWSLSWARWIQYTTSHPISVRTVLYLQNNWIILNINTSRKQNLERSRSATDTNENVLFNINTGLEFIIFFLLWKRKQTERFTVWFLWTGDNHGNNIEQLHKLTDLTPWSRVLLEKPTVYHLVKNIDFLRRPKFYYRVHKNTPLDAILSQMNPIHALIP
jgi:hypothetical protein